MGPGVLICSVPRSEKLNNFNDGRVAEWFKAPVLKTGVPARVPWVRIPPLPPVDCSPLFAIVRNPQQSQYTTSKRCTYLFSSVLPNQSVDRSFRPWVRMTVLTGESTWLENSNRST